jgi:hypothetical protein
MATDRAAVHHLHFAKLLGTNGGDTFAARDVDLRRWALLACWPQAADAHAFENSPTVRGWDRIATERCRFDLVPLASRGRWSGQQPFITGRSRPATGVVAAVTRARIAPRKLAAFWRAVPPVAADLHDRPGLLLRLGIGEAPVGLQGTFSVWTSAAALTDFAHRGSPHRRAMAQTLAENWYTEELFARFSVERVDGTFDGHNPLPDTGTGPTLPT